MGRNWGVGRTGTKAVSNTGTRCWERGLWQTGAPTVARSAVRGASWGGVGGGYSVPRRRGPCEARKSNGECGMDSVPRGRCKGSAAW